MIDVLRELQRPSASHSPPGGNALIHSNTRSGTKNNRPDAIIGILYSSTCYRTLTKKNKKKIQIMSEHVILQIITNTFVMFSKFNV